MKPISSLRDVQNIGLTILCDIHRFCTERGIRYFLVGGTLIGAVRHKGFIPWDDDVDIGMPRPDYDRFLSEYQSPVYEVHAPETHRGSFRPFAKVVDTRTVMPDDSFPGDKAGIWVDVFPFDGAGEADYSPSSDSRIWRMLSNLLVLRNLRLFSRRRSFLKALVVLLASPLRLIPNRVLYTPLRRMATRHPFATAPRRGCLVWGSGRKELLSAAAIDHEVDVSFEGMTFRAMCGWREYLSSVYGDYMTFPPEEKRTPGHRSKVFFRKGVASE